MANRDIWPPMKTQTPYYLNYKADLKARSKMYPLVSFSPVMDNIKTEVANWKNVWQQYDWPLETGMTNDIEGDFATLEKQAKAAGFDKAVSEIRAQIADYLKARGQ